MAINIPTSVFKTYNEAIELFLQTVTIVYPPKKEDCPNCIFQTFGGRSINVYQAGGPIPFARGSICPFCHGRGVKLVETTEDVKVRVYWDKKYFNLRSEAKNFYDLMFEAGILYYSADSCAAHINKIHLNPMEWWMTDKVQYARKIFIENFCNPSKNISTDLSIVIKQFINEYKI